jgi:hypothetical protein
MSKPGYAINDVTSTKQTANSASGIVVLASHDNESSVDSTVADFYFHNYIDLNTSGATLTPTASRVPTATLVPTATPTLGPVNTNRQVFVPVSQN